MKECKHTYTHSLTHADETSIYEPCKLLLAFLLQCVTDSRCLKQEGVLLEQSQAPFGRRDASCYCSYHAEELVTHLLHLLFHLASPMAFEYFSAK